MRKLESSGTQHFNTAWSTCVALVIWLWGVGDNMLQLCVCVRTWHSDCTAFICNKLLVKSQTHRTVVVGRDLWRLLGICPLGATLEFLSFDSILRPDLGLLVLLCCVQ